MNRLKGFVAAIDTASEYVGRVTLWLIPVMVVIITFEVCARYFFNSPTLWAYETTQFVFCAAIALGGGYTLLYHRHVNVDMLYNRLKTRSRAIMDCITLPFLITFIAILFKLTLDATIEGLYNGERSASYWGPTVIPVYVIMTAGVLLILLQGIANWLRSFMIAVTGVEMKSKYAAAVK